METSSWDFRDGDEHAFDFRGQRIAPAHETRDVITLLNVRNCYAITVTPHSF